MVARPALTTLVLCMFLALNGFAAAPAKKVVAKKPTSKAKAAATKVRAKSTTRKASTSRKPVRRSRASLAARPMSPAADRLRLVQAALIERGYLAGEPTGTWDAASVEALKKMEAQHNVRVDGKLDSKMLILLGLGPKYEAKLSLPGDDAVAAGDSN